MSSTFYPIEEAVFAEGATAAPFLSEGGLGPARCWSNIPIPPPRPRVMAHMRDLVSVCGGQALPLHFGEAAMIGGFRLTGLGASLFGTACRAPLLSEEAENFRAVTEDHVLIVRLDETATHGCLFTVDILLSYAQMWLLRYRLWQHFKDGDYWLVPTQGEGRSFRISQGLLALSPRAPFFCPYERNHGFGLAAESVGALHGAY